MNRRRERYHLFALLDQHRIYGHKRQALYVLWQRAGMAAVRKELGL